MKKELIKDLLIVFVTFILAMGGSYVTFAQRVAKMEASKADVEEVAEVKQSVVQLVEKLENNIQAQQDLREQIAKSSDKNDKAQEKLRAEIEKTSEKNAQAMEKTRQQIQQMSQKSAEDLGELKGKLEMLIQALNNE